MSEDEIKNNRQLLLQLSAELKSISKNLDSLEVLMNEIKSYLIKINYTESQLERGKNIEKSTGWFVWN